MARLIPKNKGVRCFGPFVADLDQETLAKAGELVSIERKPFQILAALLERPGETITYDELARKLWGEVTVEFRVNINTQVSKLRSTLGESGTTPHYIKTKVGDGYAFNPEIDVAVLRLGPVEPTEKNVVRVKPDDPGRSSWTSRSWRTWVAVLSVLGLSAAISRIYRPWLPVPNPTSLTLHSTLLTVFDQYNQPIWSKVMPRPALNELPGYQMDTIFTWWKFADLDGDGRNELLLPFEVVGDDGTKLLYCFDHKGRMMWSKPYRLGHVLETQNGLTMPDNYTVRFVDVLNKPRADGGQIVVAGQCGPGAAYLVELLTKKGEKVAEYYHPGWFFSLTVTDLDGDGFDELVFGGVNNAKLAADGSGATLVILDSRRIAGQGWSPVNDPRHIKDLPQRLERAVVFLPDFGPEEHETEYTFVRGVSRRNQSLVFMVTRGYHDSSVANYQLGFQMNVVEVLSNAKLSKWILTQKHLLAADQRSQFEAITSYLSRIEIVKNELEHAVTDGDHQHR